MDINDPEITHDDCRIANGTWIDGRCIIPRSKPRHTVSYRKASGAIERIRNVPLFILDDVVEVLYEHGSIYDVQVEGLPYFKYHYLYGGTVKPMALQESERDIEIQKSRWKSHKFIRGKGRDD